MDAQELSIDDLELRAARKHAEREVSRIGVEDESLADLLTVYTATQRAGMSEAHALEVSSGLARDGYAPRNVEVNSLDEFLREVKKAPDQTGSLIAGLHERLLRREGPPPRVQVDARFYERAPPVEHPTIIGCDEQISHLVGEVERLLMYNPVTRTNTEKGARDRGVLLSGPPGTGKTSLCEYAIAEAEQLSAMSGVPFRFEQFQASDYSKWVGESAQIIREKYARVSDSSGVGIFVLDDLDMVIQSRDDASSNHGGLQVTGQLMQQFSGLRSSPYDNVLLLGTTNRPDKIDAALLRRFTTYLDVPAYQRVEEHREFVDELMSWASEPVRGCVAQYGFANGLTPARLSSLVEHLDRERRGRVDRSIFSLPLEERAAAREKQYRDLSLGDVEGLLANYCVSYNSLT